MDIETGQVTLLISQEPDTYLSNTIEWSPDGATLYYMLWTSGRLFAYDRASGKSSEISGFPAGPMARFALSPDGQRLAAIRTRDGESVLYTFELADGQATELVHWRSPEGMGRHPMWTPDGKQILLWKRFGLGQKPAPEKAELWRVSADSGAAHKTELTANKPYFSTGDVHPDNRRFAYLSGKVQFEVWALRNLQIETATPATEE